jgi:folylpolyglutamate synthase/dihydropteroate synthase
MKELTFKVFFSSNRAIQGMSNWTKKEFKWKFNGIYNMFAAIKRKDHRALSHILQRIESEIMIQNVCKRISSEHPTLPIFTIHDSVLTTDGNQEYIAKIIKEEALKIIGLKVSLGIEILNQK